MTQILYLPNRFFLIWALCPEAPADLARRAPVSGLPFPAPDAGFSLPKTPVRAVAAGALLLVFPASQVIVLARWRTARLSQEERLLVALDRRGFTSAQIARRLWRSPRWVRYRLEQIRVRLGQTPQPKIARHRAGKN